MQILLDTNFILTCTKQKIDFVETANQIITEEIIWIIPEDIIKEIEKIKNSKEQKTLDKKAADLSLQIIELLKYKKIKLSGKNPNVDLKIINYIKEKPIVIATLDKKLKSKIENRVLTIRKGKTLELI